MTLPGREIVIKEPCAGCRTDASSDTLPTGINRMTSRAHSEAVLAPPACSEAADAGAAAARAHRGAAAAGAVGRRRRLKDAAGSASFPCHSPVLPNQTRQCALCPILALRAAAAQALCILCSLHRHCMQNLGPPCSSVHHGRVCARVRRLSPGLLPLWCLCDRTPPTGQVASGIQLY